MSKTISLRVSDEIHSALAAQCLATGQTMTELLTPHILGLIDLPPSPPDPLEVRLMALETQMISVVSRLAAVASDTPAPKISPESSRDIEEMSISTPSDISESPSEAELTQLIEGVLRTHVPSGGVYFRIEDIGKPELKMSIRKQAALLGFKSEPIGIDGKQTRVWLNREHCKQTASNL
jgi:hypothetical protein